MLRSLRISRRAFFRSSLHRQTEPHSLQTPEQLLRCVRRYHISAATRARIKIRITHETRFINMPLSYLYHSRAGPEVNSSVLAGPEEDEFFSREQDQPLQHAGQKSRDTGRRQVRVQDADPVGRGALEPRGQQDQHTDQDQVDMETVLRGIAVERGFPVLEIAVNIGPGIGQEKRQHIAPVVIAVTDGLRVHEPAQPVRQRCLPAMHQIQEQVDQHQLQNRHGAGHEHETDDLTDGFKLSHTPEQ